jgi:hypothetical protein
MVVIEHWSFGMDYETKEIVITAFLNGEEIQLRACEKTVKSMKVWFDLAKQK